MKRKAGAQSQPGPISAIAARRARQKLAEAEQASHTTSNSTTADEQPPLKKTKSSATLSTSKSISEKPKTSQWRESTQTSERVSEVSSSRKAEDPPDTLGPGRDTDETYKVSVEDNGSRAIGVTSDSPYSSNSPDTPLPQWEDFLLSKTRLNKESIAYDGRDLLCLRVNLKTTLVLVGQYDLWVKKGVVSILGTKLQASPRLHRVYAPSTHSLPVIKCVSGGIEGFAEIEIGACRNGITQLGEISKLYEGIWAGEQTVPRKKLKCDGQSFSVLYSASDDQLKRYLRPLHLEKRWSTAIKDLSQRGPGLRVLTCGPKASGKSTFNKYLFNHLLSAPPSQGSHHPGKDGVAFLDLDPGQPEFSASGSIYLAHLRNPILGPPFSHPTLNTSNLGTIVRSHYIGATSPKDDSDHYAMAITDLMDRFQRLRHQYPQCALIINYSGWIFGQGLEIASWLVRTLDLSDMVYMSDKGPEEVVVPLEAAASHSGVPMTILPSQPTERFGRSSSQLRSMQMLSYFHSCQIPGSDNPVWSDIPLTRSQSMTVNYSGDKQSIFGIMAPGFPQEPEMLRDFLDGAVVGVVALENMDTIAGTTAPDGERGESINDQAMDNEVVDSGTRDEIGAPEDPHLNITRTKEQLPYLFIGSGTCLPPDPRLSYSLGLAIVRSIDVETQTLDLVTPIPAPTIRNALDQGEQIVLVRGQLDNPNWAISEEYFAARAAQNRQRQRVAQRNSDKKEESESSAPPSAYDMLSDGMAAKFREWVGRAGDAPWMRVSGDVGKGKTNQTRRNKRSRAETEDAEMESG